MHSRRKETERKRDKSLRNKLEAGVERLLKAEESESDDLAHLSPSSSQETVLVALNVVLEPGATVGQAIYHTWFNTDTDREEDYYGVIIKFKKKCRSCEFTIAYRKPEESSEEAEDYVVTVKQFVSDLLLGDLTFNV